MLTEYLTIARAIVHEIPEGQVGQAATPVYSKELVNLSTKARTGLQDRITSALGHTSKAVQMHKKEADSTGVHATISKMYHCKDSEFISLSSNLADRLAGSQNDRRIPGGKLIVFTGTVSTKQAPILGIIKAELETGFQENLRFLENIFLTPSQKMYKIALFVKSSGKKEAVWIYDNNMSSNEERGAASYFYASFLACEFHPSNARLTQLFYTKTKTFIDSLKATPERKIELVNALSSYLKSNEQVISPTDFSKSHFDKSERQSYDELLHENNISRGISKDLARIDSSLRTRRIVFGSKIKVSGPADEFNRSVKVISSDATSTTLRIMGSIQNQ